MLVYVTDFDIFHKIYKSLIKELIKIAIINKIDNKASVVYNGSTINSNSVETLLLVAPTILKTVDKLTASIGEKLIYTVTITNVGLSEITNLAFSDVIPTGSSYVEGSFKVNNSSVIPQNTNNTLSYTIPNIAALGIATVQFEVTVVGRE